MYKYKTCTRLDTIIHKTRQDKTRQDKTRQDKTRYDDHDCHKARQDKTQDKTGQAKIRPDTIRDNTTQFKTNKLLTEGVYIKKAFFFSYEGTVKKSDSILFPHAKLESLIRNLIPDFAHEGRFA